ncbi:MAG: hypothetical protein WBC31_05620, partial [Candidatus Phosphoribacter baldrii]
MNPPPPAPADADAGMPPAPAPAPAGPAGPPQGRGIPPSPDDGHIPRPGGGGPGTDDAAFESLYRTCAPRVFAYVRRHV